ncbi:S-layer homology domain-containing protein [Oscillatoriales cyanobacterium LEGE 11467]|uniref:S-layer homology domain-containing protein n=1 Tax=Zarconia navalis LEGE 11467 TaxID=1828826 RepID=A0A928VWR2_9CYAN|nr:S-layer homology domain-containing protein [Zarconia navalis]MBE9041652.1 S-layer homology domain-containing protein [Zarconia navalis LEGE 11467]
MTPLKLNWQTAWQTAIAGVGGLLLWTAGWVEPAYAGRAILNRSPQLLDRYFGIPLEVEPCNNPSKNLSDERECIVRVYEPSDLAAVFPELEQNTLSITFINDRSIRIDLARAGGDLTYTPAKASKLFNYLFGYRAPVWWVYSDNRNRDLPIWNYQACLGDGIATAYSSYSSPSGSVPDLSVFYNPDCEATEYTFGDIRSHWAKPFIENLAIQGIVAGFPDGTYRPDASVTRAEFAALVSKALRGSYERSPVEFADVPWDFWAYDAIGLAYERGFLTGYPSGIFAPNQAIPKVQAIVSISGGLGLASDALGVLLAYADGREIPDYAKFNVAGATQWGIVVNYPRLDRLEPNRPATRGEIAAFIYQARFGSDGFIDSPYIVIAPSNPISPEIQLKMVGFF